MQSETLSWIILFLSLFAIMFIIVPPRKGPELSRFGFWLGIVQAIFILWIGQHYLGLFLAKGDPTLFGVPIFVTLVWFPPTVIFAYFFPRADTTLKKFLYIFMFASGTTVGQIVLENFGLWVSLKWNPIYTFLLALVTHSIMTMVLLRFKREPDFSRVFR